MSARHSKEWHVLYKPESAYAAGSGSTAYDQTKLANTGNFQGSYPKTYADNMFPAQVLNKEKLQSNESGAFGGKHLTTGWKDILSSREVFVQTANEFVFFLSSITSGQGTIPPSYSIHWQESAAVATQRRYEAYGGIIEGFTYTAPTNDGTMAGFPSITMEEFCYSLKEDVGAGTDVDSLDSIGYVDLSTNPPMSGSTLTNGSTTTYEMMDFAFTGKHRFKRTKDQGDDGVKYPYYLGTDLTLECHFQDYDQYAEFIQHLWIAAEGESLYTFKIVTGITDYNIQFTNMLMNDGNFNRIPENGLAEYTIKFESTSTTVLTNEAT